MKVIKESEFINEINEGLGSPIEVDAASNSGGDNVRQIISDARERSLDSKYKIYIIDEAHSISSQGWQAFLKCIEEPPMYTIFIFCTTEFNKIPDTIKNRCQCYTFNSIDSHLIYNRLEFVCKSEKLENYEESISYISKQADGSMRNALTMLDKCISDSTTLDLYNTQKTLGTVPYSLLFNLVDKMLDGNEQAVLEALECVVGGDMDLKLFVDNLFSFCMDISKYIIFGGVENTRLLESMTDEIKKITSIQSADKYYMYLINNVFELKKDLKYSTTQRDIVELYLLKMTRCL